ncbi:MAG: hypothetical protein KBS68_03220 [Clostridiales bacterium]|nr:hypothetical protein [Candidatus Crickella merdequi]
MSEYTFYLPRKEIKFASRAVKQELLENQLRAIDSTLQLIAGFNAAVSSFLAKEQSIINNHEKSRVMDSALEDMKAELVEWEEADYETNHNYLHELVHPTVKGHMVRSKSEAMIADGFYANGIPYRYEEKNILNGHIHYTDFAMRHPVTGKHYKLEHNGLMDKPDYIRKTGYRLIDYSAEGWLLGKNFFMTMETKNSPLTKSEIQLVIDTILSDETSE